MKYSYVYLLSPFGLLCRLRPMFPCLMIYHCYKWGVLKSLTIIVLLQFLSLVLFIFALYLGAPMLSEHLQVLYHLIGLNTVSLCNAFICLFK